jgi:hypothetical protein
MTSSGANVLAGSRKLAIFLSFLSLPIRLNIANSFSRLRCVMMRRSAAKLFFLPATHLPRCARRERFASSTLHLAHSKAMQQMTSIARAENKRKGNAAIRVSRCQKRGRNGDINLQIRYNSGFISCRMKARFSCRMKRRFQI